MNIKQVLIFIVAIFLSMCNIREFKKDDFIRIEHFAPGDEQIKVIVISVDEIPKNVDWERNYILSQKHFLVIEEFISEYIENNPELQKKDDRDWTVFRIVLFISGVTKKHVLSSKEISVNFFMKLSDLLSTYKDDKAVLELKNQVDVILDQIN